MALFWIQVESLDREYTIPNSELIEAMLQLEFNND